MTQSDANEGRREKRKKKESEKEVGGAGDNISSASPSAGGSVTSFL
jgi:hypothetical protein